MEFLGELRENMHLDVNVFKGKAQAVVSMLLEPSALQVVVCEPTKPCGVSYARTWELCADDASKAAESLLETLRQALEALQAEGYDLKNLPVILALREQCYEDELIVPKLEQDDLLEALSWEIPQHIPWEEGSYAYRFQLASARQNSAAEVEEDEENIAFYAVENAVLEPIFTCLEKLELCLDKLTVAESIELNDVLQEAVNAADFYESFYNGNELEQLRTSYALPVAAAISFSLGTLKIDFLPAKLQRQAWLKSMQKVFLNATVFLLLLSFCLTGYVMTKEHYAQAELEKAKEQYASLALWEPRRQALEKLQADSARLQKQVEQLEAKKTLWSKNLQSLGQLLPSGCWLTKLEVQESNAQAGNSSILLLSGKAQDQALVSRFTENLQTSKSYAKVELLNSGLPGNTAQAIPLLEFQLRAQVQNAPAKTNAAPKPTAKQ